MTARRTCIVGFGKIAAGYAADPVMARHYRYTTHSQVLLAHPRFDWIAAVDPAPEARAAASALKKGVETAATAIDLKSGRDAEVLVLATPPGPERLHILGAFPALKAVLVEKPLGRTLDEARAFLAACTARGVLVQVALWRRADPTFRALAGGDLARRIGTLQTGHAVYGNGLHNNGVHMVDMIRMLCGEIVAVQAIGPLSSPQGLPIPGDIQVDAALTLANGRNVFLSALDFTAYREVGLDMWGTVGRLSISQEGLTISHFPRTANRAMSGEREIAGDAPQALPSTVGEAFWHLYDDLAHALDHGGALASPGESALVSETVVEQILLSAHTETRRVLSAP
jgi:predicted dehydrogenase